MLGVCVVRKASSVRVIIGAVFLWSSVYAASASAWVINEDADSNNEAVVSDQTAQGEPSNGKLNTQESAIERALGIGSASDAGDTLSAAEFEAQHLEALRAVKVEQAKIRLHWPDVMMSDAVQWVSYSNDYQVRRRVDFSANLIDISLFSVRKDSAGFQKTRDIVEQELRSVLTQTVAQAMTADPFFGESLVAQVVGSEYGQSWVFSELFLPNSPAKQTAANAPALTRMKEPSARTVRRLVRRMMQRAEVKFYQQQASAGVQIPVQLSKRLTYTIPLPDNRLRKKAKQFRPHILDAAKSMDVPADLVYAVIHTESHFNPLARSHIPAYGLMQIVPRTAGRDATRVIYDKSRLLSPAYLFDPEKNIKVGAAYLRLLYFHYLKDIKDPKSRLYCAIAAYNTGVGNVARVFGKRPAMSHAASRINALSAQQVLAALLESLPARQTREYLKKVLARKSLYSRV